MAEQAGFTNQVFILAGAVAMSGSTGAKILGIDNSTYNKLCEILDITSFGNTHRKRMAGLLDSSINISGNLYVGDTTGQDVLVAGASCYIGTYPSGTGAAGTQIPAIVENIEVSSAVDGKQTISASLLANGAPVALPLRP